MEEIYKKFTSLEKCSLEEVKLLLENYNHWGSKEKVAINLVCFMLVREVLKVMYKQKSTSYIVAREMYRDRGFTDEYFDKFFRLYIFYWMPSNEKKEYISFMKSLLRDDIIKAAKNKKWSAAGIQEIAEEYVIPVNSINDIITEYFKVELKLDSKEMYNYKNHYIAFRQFLDGENITKDGLNKVVIFYNEYANDEERRQFRNRYAELVNEFKEGISNISVYELYTIGANTKMSLIGEIAASFKEYYVACTDACWSMQTIKKLAKESGIPYNEFRDMGKAYGSVVLGLKNIDEIVINYHSRSLWANFQKAPIIKKILDEDKEEKWKALIIENNIMPVDITRYCYTYNKELPRKVKDMMFENLIVKVRMARQENKRNEVKVKYTLEMAYLYINGDLTLEEFAKQHNLKANNFKEAIKKFADNGTDPEVYSKFVAKITEEKQASLKKEEDTVLEILDCIKNGIMINGSLREFTLVDFFMRFKDVNYKVIRTAFLPKEEASYIREFFFPLTDKPVISKSAILTSSLTIFIPTSEGGYLKEFTPAELADIVNIMVTYKMPIIDLIFRQVCIQYATKTLIDCNNEKNSLK